MSTPVEDKPPQSARTAPASLRLLTLVWVFWLIALGLTFLVMSQENAALVNQPNSACGTELTPCANVFISPYAEIFDIRLSWYGLSFLATFALVLLASMFVWQASLSPPTSLIVPIAGSLGVVGGLWCLVVMVFRLHLFCGTCFSLHVMYLALFLASLAYAKQDWAHRQFIRWRSGDPPLPTTPIAIMVFLGLLFTSAELIGLNLGRAALPKPADVIRVEAKLIVDETAAFLWNDMPVLPGSPTRTAIHTIKGNAAAPHVIVLFSCPTCPSCRSASRCLEAVLKRHPNEFRVDVRFDPIGPCNDRYRNIQLDKEQRSACIFTRAATAVAHVDPSAFSDYLNWLYDNQGDLNAVEVLAEAKARVDPSLFDEAADSNEVWLRSEQDMQLATSMDSKTVPRLFIPAGEIMGQITPNRLDTLLAQHFDWQPALNDTYWNDKVWIAKSKVEAIAQDAIRLDTGIQDAQAAASYEIALRLDPRSIEIGTRMAWLLATTPDDKVYDPKRALRYARIAVQEEQDRKAGGTPNPKPWDVLGAALAANGKFEAAQRRGERAVKLYLQQQNDESAAKVEERVKLYLKGESYRREPIPIDQ